MSDAHALTVENLLRVFPEALRNDKSIVALAQSVASVLAERVKELRGLTIYSRIDKLPETLLDILAYDFKVDWWDSNYSPEQKRATLKSSWFVHRRLGTVGAVRAALQAVYPHIQVLEWFDYGGEPYHFRILIGADDGGFDPEKHRQVLQRMQWYKNLRSQLDAVQYAMPITVVSENSGSLVPRRFRVGFRTVTYGGELTRLDGGRVLNGSWYLNQVSQGGSMAGMGVHVRVRGQQCRFTGTLTQTTMWPLDGSVSLDGSRRLNAGITKEEL